MVRIQDKHYRCSDLQSIQNEFRFYLRMLRVLSRKKKETAALRLVKALMDDIIFDYKVATLQLKPVLTKDGNKIYCNDRMVVVPEGRIMNGNNSNNDNEAGTGHNT